MKGKAKLKALQKVEKVLHQQERPFARACGITEEEFLALTEPDNPLLDVNFIADTGDTLDIHKVNHILPAGLALLANAPEKSKWPERKWTIIQAAIGAIIATALGLIAAYITFRMKWK